MVNGPFKENAYIVWNNKNSFIIDPGGELNKIIAKLAKENLKPSAILNTHAHLDHIGAVSGLIKYGSYPFYLHYKELDLLNEANKYCTYFGIKNIEIPHVDNIIDENTSLHIFDPNIEIIETPGHTPGGVSFLIENNLFTGDTLFRGSIGRTDLPGGNENLLISSIKNKIMCLDDNILVYPGHGPPTTLGFERIYNNFLN